MKPHRREFLREALLGGALVSTYSNSSYGDESHDSQRMQLDQALRQPVLRRGYFREPVIIESIDLLRNGAQYLVRVRSTDGAVGYAASHSKKMRFLYPILVKLVAPYFVGKDARHLDRLIDGVYLHESNYKLQGLALWVCVASVEFAILDMLGHVADVSIGELLGGRIREEIGVYLANNYRGVSAVTSVRRIAANLEKYPVKAIKFKIGGRMQNEEVPAGRTEELIPLLRKALGSAITIYADSNGSYDAREAIRVGRLLQEHGIAFYEEPCPFDHMEETLQVANALDIPIAGGEQESSLRRFRWMIENQAVQVVQPDLFYFGGFIRSIRVARMAATAEMDCVPHISNIPFGSLYVLHFASCVPNVGEHMEYKGEHDAIPFSSRSSSFTMSLTGTLTAPTGSGLGVTIEEDYLKESSIVKI